MIEAIAAQMEAVAAKHPDEDVAALFLGTGAAEHPGYPPAERG